MEEDMEPSLARHTHQTEIMSCLVKFYADSFGYIFNSDFIINNVDFVV